MIITILLWLILGLLTGILLFFIGGFVTTPLGVRWRYKAADWYSKLAQKLLEGSALVERGTGYDLVSITGDTSKGGDTFDLDGETAHVTNDTGAKSTLYKRDFGLVPPPEDDVAVYVNPELAELGELETERQEQGTITDDDGLYNDIVDLPDNRPLVRLREFARRMIPGSRNLFDLDESTELFKQSQLLYKDAPTMQYMILIIAYGVGALLTWLIVTNAGGAAPTGIDLPMVLAPGVMG